MAYSKIILNGETLMDVTEDTVDSGNLLSGETATKNSGAKVTGSLSPVTDVTVNGTSVVTSGVAAVTVPDVSGKIDTAGTGLSKSSTTLNHSNSITAQNTQAVYPIKIDAQGHISAYGSSVTVPTITDTYSGTSSNGMSGKAVKSAIDALDGTISGSAGSGKTLTAFSQTNGKVSATFGNISITKSQVSDFPTIPTVNNATLTIQKNGTTVNTFTANSSSNVTANIAVHDVPSGGASGQILTKNSSTDYDASWVSPTETPTASKVSLFDSSAHMNSTDMTSQEVDDFVDSLNISGTSILNVFYPVGSIYQTIDDGFNPNIRWGGTWELIEEGRFLQATETSAAGGDTVSAGLPNIGGYLDIRATDYNASNVAWADGVFIKSTTAGYSVDGLHQQNGAVNVIRYNFDAHYYNSIYGNSTTVQPPSIKVYMWHRTA